MNRKGQALVIVLGILSIFMIFLPALVFLNQHESKWSVKQKKTTDAYHAAEAGIDRGIWKLNENNSIWDTVREGGTIPGYHGDTAYDLSTGTATRMTGQYKITLSSGTYSDQVRLTCVGQDISTNEVRAIEVILTKLSIDSALTVDGALDWKPNMTVHWGPVVSFTSIAGGLQYFPRKFSKGMIADRDQNPTPPNTDGKEWWSFQNLGTPPQIDLAAYRELAQNHTSIASPNVEGTANPPNSGYFEGDVRIKAGGFTDTNAVIYATGKIRFDNNSFLDVAAALAESDVVFKAKSAGYTATLPQTVDLEYQAVPALAYPGRGSATYTIPDCGFHGFLYAGGNFDAAGGNAIICGVLKVNGTMQFNTFTIYYDRVTAQNIKVTSAPIRRISWKEVPLTW